mgnify:CR=1 FL=1
MHCLSIEYNHTYHTTGMVSKYYTSAGPGYVLHMRNDLKSGSIARNSWKAYYGTQLPHHRWGDQERCIKASRLALSGPWGTFIIFLNLDRFYAHPCKFTEIYVTPTMVVCECFVLVRQIATELQCINKLVVYKVSGLRTSSHIRVYNCENCLTCDIGSRFLGSGWRRLCRLTSHTCCLIRRVWQHTCITSPLIYRSKNLKFRYRGIVCTDC